MHLDQGGSGDRNEGLRNIRKTEQTGLGSDCGSHERSEVKDDLHFSMNETGELPGGHCYRGVELSAGLGRAGHLGIGIRYLQ